MKYYVDFITKTATDKLTPFEKIKMIIRLVRQNRVLIIENGLSPDEEAELIKQTMTVIDFDDFIGLEFFNWNRESSKTKSFFKRSSASNENRYTVVAPSEAVQVIENSQDLLSLKLGS